MILRWRRSDNESDDYRPLVRVAEAVFAQGQGFGDEMLAAATPPARAVVTMTSVSGILDIQFLGAYACHAGQLTHVHTWRRTHTCMHARKGAHAHAQLAHRPGERREQVGLENLGMPRHCGQKMKSIACPTWCARLATLPLAQCAALFLHAVPEALDVSQNKHALQ